MFLTATVLPTGCHLAWRREDSPFPISLKTLLRETARQWKLDR